MASLQNGWGNGDVLARAYAAEQLVVGVTYNSGTVLDTGRVAHPGVGPTTIGSFTDGATDGADRLAQALSDGGLEVVIAAPIRPEIWKKLILNAASLPTAALTGLTAGALTAHEGMHELVTETAREAVCGRPSPRLRHRRGGTRRVHPQALAERRLDQGVHAPGRRGRPPHRDRRDQRRGGGGGRRGRRRGAAQPGLRRSSCTAGKRGGASRDHPADLPRRRRLRHRRADAPHPHRSVPVRATSSRPARPTSSRRPT